jgi:hypothetical protein
MEGVGWERGVVHDSVAKCWLGKNEKRGNPKTANKVRHDPRHLLCPNRLWPAATAADAGSGGGPRLPGRMGRRGLVGVLFSRLTAAASSSSSRGVCCGYEGVDIRRQHRPCRAGRSRSVRARVDKKAQPREPFLFVGRGDGGTRAHLGCCG